jgi:hypothetical protein
MEARHASRSDLPRNQPANLPTFQRDVSWHCLGKHDGSPETYAAPETGAGCSVGAALHRCRLRFDRQRRPARRVKVDSAPDRRDTRVLGRWFGIAPFPEHCTSNAIAKSSGGVGIITRPIVRLARSSSFYHFVQMDGHRRWVLANERSHLIGVARDLPVAADR